MIQKVEQLAEELRAGVAALAKPDAEALLSLFENQCRNRRFPECRVEDDGDMVLFEWHPGKDWTPDEENFGDEDLDDVFEVNLCRQFMPDDDEEPIQMHLSMRFDPKAGKDLARPSGNLWTDPDGARRDIEDSEVWTEIRDVAPNRVVVWATEC